MRENTPTSRDFFVMGLTIMGRERSRASTKTLNPQFKSWFGVEPLYLSLTWLLLLQSGWLAFGCRPQPVHLLWTFMWFKVYATEGVHAGQVGCDEKTLRERVCFVQRALLVLIPNW